MKVKKAVSAGGPVCHCPDMPRHSITDVFRDFPSVRPSLERLSLGCTCAKHLWPAPAGPPGRLGQKALCLAPDPSGCRVF